MRSLTPYDDQYPTCNETHAWLRIMHEDLDPDEISCVLGLTPTKVQRRGEPVPSKPERRYSKSGWFLKSDGLIQSKDSRRHLDWILNQIGSKKREMATLHERGYLIDACVYWDSMHGHGGPTISPSQMSVLAALEVEIWFDVYFPKANSQE